MQTIKVLIILMTVAVEKTSLIGGQDINIGLRCIIDADSGGGMSGGIGGGMSGGIGGGMSGGIGGGMSGGTSGGFGGGVFAGGMGGGVPSGISGGMIGLMSRLMGGGFPGGMIGGFPGGMSDDMLALLLGALPDMGRSFNEVSQTVYEGSKLNTFL